ncbi:unnamed protein product [Parajaminaea phylloscopi]
MGVTGVLIINNYGKPRLATFYPPLPTSRQQLLIRTIFRLVSDRPDGELCNFLEAPELKPLLPVGHDATQKDLRVVYRHYATLWFVLVVDQNESELGILDLIQVFVESLDRFFPNVCELDLIFHYEEVNAILSEVIQGGTVLETNISEIVKQSQAAAKARKASASASSGTAAISSGGLEVGMNAAVAAAGWAKNWISNRR